MHTTNIANWLAVNYIFANCPKKIITWFNDHLNLENLFTASADELRAYNISASEQTHLKAPNWRLVEGELNWLKQIDHHCITLADADYPSILKEIAQPPLLLYAKGNKALLHQAQIAIVGARSATPQGMINAENFAAAFASADFVVTSGLARGIDTAAHRGALNASGNTIAVFGTGFKHIYPRENKKLANKISETGLIISEFALDTPPFAYNFPRRNRIIAGLCKGVLVAEAALKSGSLITAYLALESGRDVFAIPGSIHQPLYRGCHKLIQQGAKLTQTPDDVLSEYIATESPVKKSQKVKKLSLSPAEEQVYEQIGDEITPIDMIILRSQLTASEVCSILLALELKGYVQCGTGGYLRIFL